MGIREKINEKQTITIVAASVVIVLAFVYIFSRTVANTEPPLVISEKGWFTTDDGKTWFPDELKKIPPFKTSDGKTAVRAFLFKCGDGEPFVVYLQRYSQAAKQQLEGGATGGAEGGTGDEIGYGGSGAAAIYSGVQIKKPGEREWISTQNTAAAGVRNPVCPDGGADLPEPVIPAIDGQ